jgi:hypothetical protein
MAGVQSTALYEVKPSIRSRVGQPCAVFATSLVMGSWQGKLNWVKVLLQLLTELLVVPGRRRVHRRKQAIG